MQCELCELAQPPAIAMRKEQAARPPPPPPVVVPPPVPAAPLVAVQAIAPPTVPAVKAPAAPAGAAVAAAAAPASSTNFVVGVAVKVSTAAVPADASAASPALVHALYALFTQGILLHAGTGTVALLDARASHAVFVELPALDAWPLIEDFTVTHHPFLLNGLSALGAARTDVFAVNNRTVPFAIDLPTRSVAAVCRALLDGDSAALGTHLNPVSFEEISVAKENPATKRPYTAEEVQLALAPDRKTLDELWSLDALAGIPRSKLARRRFIALMQDRILFIRDVRRFAIMNKFSAAGSITSKILRAADSIGSSFIQRLALVMLAEATNREQAMFCGAARSRLHTPPSVLPYPSQ